MEAVPAGTFLAQFTGEVLAKEELENRMANLYQMGQPLYLLPLGQTAVVDATKKGSIARLGVHSCNPSAEVKPWLVEVKFLQNYFHYSGCRSLQNMKTIAPFPSPDWWCGAAGAGHVQPQAACCRRPNHLRLLAPAGTFENLKGSRKQGELL